MADEVKSVAEIRERFRKQLDGLVATAKNHDQAAQGQEQRKWTQIDKNGWSGKLTDLEGLSKAFDREENALDYQDAIKDPEAPGTVGDLSVAQLQGDYLACQERAFRARHMSTVRATLHAAGRRRGHGHARGVLTRSTLYYLEELLRASKE